MRSDRATGSKRVLFGLALLAGVLAVGRPIAGAQEEGRFGEVVDVRLVNVEVWVTDDNGAHIHGLTTDDFVVLEDGEPVEITYFAEIRRNRLLLDEPPADESPGDERPPQPGVVERGSTREPNHLVVYLDHLHTAPASQKRMVDDLREMLWDLRVPPERMLILSQGRELQTELPFGSRREEVEAALQRIVRAGSRGGTAGADKRLAIRNLQQLWKTAEELGTASPRTSNTGSAACEYFMPRAISDIEMYMLESRERLVITLDHLSSVAAFLSGVPGVKTLLYASDSLERAPGTDLAAFANDLCPGWQDSRLFVLGEELSRDFERLTRHANANRVTIYSLQTSGLEGNFTMGADQGFMEFRGTRSFDALKRSSEREGASVLASRTGGRIIVNRNQFDRELAKIADEMENYYSLAYEPPHGGDRGEHEIEVKLAGHDFHLRHRQGYQDKDPDVRMAERLQGALYLGLVENPLGVRLGAGTVETVGAKKVMVPLHVVIPADRIVFLPAEEREIARLSLQLRTQNTRTHEGVFETQAFEIPRPPGDGELISLLIRLRLPEGVHVVAVGVRDDTTREASFVSTTLELHRSSDTLSGG